MASSQISSLLSSSDIQSLIEQASTANQLPATTLQDQEKPIQAQISALGTVQSTLSDLQSALSQLSNVESLTQRTVSSSASGVVTATATNAASLGTYSLTNVHLAHAETLISSGSASSSGSLGSGSISIKVGDNTTVTVNIASGSSSLSGIAAAINQANAGVGASVVFDGASYHLVLTGNASGTANAFAVTGTGGLAALSYSSGTSGLGLRETQDATNAGFTYNGISVTSGSNTIGGVISGLTLNLAGSGSATVSVAQSTTSLESAAQSVVQALNTVLTTINKETAFTAASGGGPLLGDVGIEELQQSLLNSVTAQIGAGSTAGASSFNSLSSIGFQITSGGTVTFSDSTFESAAQTNYAAVASLLGAIGVASNSNVSVTSIGEAKPGTYAVDVTSNNNGVVSGTINGLAASGTGGVLTVTSGSVSLAGLALQIASGVTGNLGNVTVSQGLYGSLSSIVNATLASGSGGVAGQVSSLNKTISSMNTQITALQKEATQETQELTNQFDAAESTLNQLTTVSNFLSTYFNQTSGSGG
ncbi:MAG TPA: flagellar filament capping protein FliD [Stellaceae bacterium]|jgi:flagellar hook-associated protein 2|nr:flagellar filament capping protein FliD [Stellaceae bacterium]